MKPRRFSRAHQLAALAAAAGGFVGCQLVGGLDSKQLAVSAPDAAADATAATDGAGAVDAGLEASPCVPGSEGCAQASCQSNAPGADQSCGPSGVTDCCERQLVKGGAYLRDYDGVDGGSYNDKGFPATVSDYALDTFEITVGRFRAFVQAGKGTQVDPPSSGTGGHPKIKGSGWSNAFNAFLQPDRAALERSLQRSELGTWTTTAADRENLPITNLNWYEAFAFCIWDGGRLPTNAEWNFAAAGGSQQRVYPWGSTIDQTRAVFDCANAHGGNDKLCTAADLGVVGSKPAGVGRWKQADLSGNAAEWVFDTACDTYGPSCVDCASVGPCPARVVRGGDVTSRAGGVKVGWGDLEPATASLYLMGARCARTP